MIRDPNPETRNGESFGTQPFGKPWPTSISGLDSTVSRVIPDSAQESAVLVSQRWDGTEVFRTQVGWSPVPLDPQQVERKVEEIADRLTGRPAFPNNSRAQLQEWTRDALYVPPALPPVARMLRSSDGEFWLEKNQLDEEPSPVWRVFSREGVPLRDVVLPSGVSLRAVHGEDLWAVQLDDMDVPYVLRLGFGKTDD